MSTNEETGGKGHAKRIKKLYEQWGSMCDSLQKEFKGKYPDVNTDEEFPENWTDPLELLGCFYRLIAEEVGLENDASLLAYERRQWQEIVDRKGARYVWDCRRGLVAERLYAYSLFGD